MIPVETEFKEEYDVCRDDCDAVYKEALSELT